MSKIIYIDPGHGNGRERFDPGAVGNGMREVDVVLEVALSLGDILRRRGIVVFYSRTDHSRVISTGARAREANSVGAGLLLSLHLNSFHLDTANGHETFFAATKPDDRAVAGIFQRAFLRETALRDRGVKMDINSQHSGGLPVLRQAKMPAVLSEIAFISANPDTLPDVPLLRDGRHVIADIYAKAVFEFFGMPMEEIIIEEEDEMRYNTLQEVADAGMRWALPTLQMLVDRDILTGTGNGFNLSEDMIRGFVINDRAGAYRNNRDAE